MNGRSSTHGRLSPCEASVEGSGAMRPSQVDGGDRNGAKVHRRHRWTGPLPRLEYRFGPRDIPTAHAGGLDLEKKRQEAVALRRAKLDAHPQAGIVGLVVHVLGSKCVLGDYLKPVIHPPTCLRGWWTARGTRPTLTSEPGNR